nr:MAG TPA: hypothetical protein [Caudoviricetes sp.]
MRLAKFKETNSKFYIYNSIFKKHQIINTVSCKLLRHLQQLYWNKLVIHITKGVLDFIKNKINFKGEKGKWLL